MILFRLPFDSNFYTTDLNPKTTAVYFKSFDNTKKIQIPGNLLKIKPSHLQKFTFQLLEKKDEIKNETKKEYLAKIENAIAVIKENQLPKLVIARKETVWVKLNLISTFENLCLAYPSAFVYIFKQDGISWIGAFSELLGRFDKKKSLFTTMSLAGTLLLDEKWTEKENEEQKTVSNYIYRILKKYSSETEQSETYDHISGNIKHLRTDFQISVKQDKVKKLINELHPTPAVCGIPKDFCQQKIVDLEHFQREFYGGYSAIETNEFQYFFVNLRCGKVWNNAVELFAGGGITALSNPEKEWHETQLKMQVLLKNMATF